jgi:methyltransferase (TIGR00027 family)
MAKEKGKSTAAGVAALRAAGAQERDPAVRNPDYLAISLLSPLLRTVAKLRPLTWLVLRQYHRVLPGGYYFHTARTKHIDAVLRQCAEQGIEQLVILGAGFDTRAHRFKDILNNTRTFEVDHPDTQANKKEQAGKLKVGSLENVIYVPIEFNTGSLDTLVEYGYSTTLTTLFIWEGVCMYITPEAVDSILSFVSKRSGPGSSIVFDYIFQSMVEGRCDYYGARESSRYVEKRGEPYIFGIEEGTIEEFLKARRLRILSEFTPEMLERTYLTGSDAKIHGKVYGYTNIVHASIQPKSS